MNKICKQTPLYTIATWMISRIHPAFPSPTPKQYVTLCSKHIGAAPTPAHNWRVEIYQDTEGHQCGDTWGFKGETKEEAEALMAVYKSSKVSA